MTKEEWGEKKPAWYLDPLVVNQARRFIIHDLRIQIGDTWIQFDHILWNHDGNFFLLKSKSYHQLAIDEFGACSVGYGQGMSDVIAPHLRLKKNEKLFMQLIKTPAFRAWIPFTTSCAHVLMPVSSTLEIAAEYKDIYLKIDDFIIKYRKGIDKETRTTGSLTQHANPQGNMQFATALLAMHTPRPTLRKQVGWESRPALLDIPEIRSLVAESAKDWSWFRFSEAPSAELRNKLPHWGYQALKENGQWTWKKSVV